MKTFLPFFLSFAALLAGSFFNTHQLPGVALVLASGFAACLTAWTFRQYGRARPALPLSPPLRLPLPGTKQTPAAPPQRLAA